MALRGSWRTSLSGVAGILTALAIIAKGFADNDMSIVWPALVGLWPSIASLFARDNKVSSQDVGIRPEVK